MSDSFQQGNIGTQVLTKDFIGKTVANAINEAIKNGPVYLLNDRVSKGKRKFSLRKPLEVVAVELLREEFKGEFVGDRISHVTVFVDGCCSVGVDA